MLKLSKAILLILPFIYLILGFYFNELIGIFSLRNVDPEYIYLTNGLYMSLGHLNVYHIDNPGTPLQMIVAVVCRVVYMFRSHEIPYLEDVFINSDLYLNIINHVVISLTAMVIFIAGYMVLKLTSFLPYALLLQTLPFYSNLTYGIIGRLTPELMVCIPVFFLTVMLIKSTQSDQRKFDLKTILFYGIISGFGLSVKLTYIPLWIIPLMVIPRWKDKGRFLLLAIVSVFVFAIPIIFDLSSFTGWIKDLLLYSGQYGGGEANILNIEKFSENFSLIFKLHRLFLIIWILCFVLVVVYVFLKRKELNRRLIYSMSAILLTTLLQVLLVSKHYEYRYLVPGLALFPALVILSFQMIKKLISYRRINFIIAFIIIAGFVYQVPKHIKYIHIVSRGVSAEINKKMQTRNFVQTLEDDAIKLLTPSGYGCPFHDFSIMISHCWAGWENEVFLPVYKKLYPDTYQFFTWENRAKYWEYPYDITRITDAEVPVYFYVAHYTPGLFHESLTALLPGYDITNIEDELIFENTDTGEKIFRLQFAESVID